MHGDMIIPSEQAIENQKQEELQISNDGKDEMEDNNQEWLNLTLGGNAMLTAEDSKSQTMPNSRNVFSCTFCKRTFFSSQALGGHQNAHKRERGTTRRYQSSRMMRMMSSPFSMPIGRQLRLQPHGLVDRTGRDIIVTVPKPQTGCGMAWTSYTLEDAMDLMWPGSFHFVPLRPEPPPSESDKIDMNLKL